METKELIGLAFLAFTLVFAFGIMWRFKRMADSRKATNEKFSALQEKLDNKHKEIAEEYERQKMRRHPNYSHARFDPKNPDVLKPRKNTQTQTVGNNSVGIQSRGSTTVSNDSSLDLLNIALIHSMMVNNSNTSRATVDYDTGRVEVTHDEPKREESSYSSSYSSSSNDDDDRKSSYSSSYSSSSSDDSYSSSSSDSSYSSSSSD